MTFTAGLSGITNTAVKIYPNPVLDQLTIELNSLSEPITLQIGDMADRVVLIKSLDYLVHKIDMSQLLPGEYFIQLLSESGSVMTTSLIKQ